MSCVNKKNHNVTWYEKETISSIDKIDENTIKVEIGISAQLFYLDKNDDNSSKIYTVLNYSFKNKKDIRIGIENYTNKILFAIKIDKK